jgi:hypothetical protein
MGRPILFWGKILLCLAGFVLSSPAAASPLKIKKGPILHYRQGQLQVWVQGKFKDPHVEWRLQGQEKQISMKKAAKKFWSAGLDELEGEYRVVDGGDATPWIPILYQKEKDKKFRVVVYGSNLTGLGHSPIHNNLLTAMKNENPSLVLHTGGLVASGGEKRFWNQFFQEGRELFQSIPFQPVIGMPDRSKTGAFAENVHAGDNERTRYYYQYGPAHFIALDTTQNFKPGSKQYRFLQETLESLRGQSPIIVYFYHPAFSASVQGGDSRVLEYLVPLFEDFGVDLVLSGQEHGYQRTHPINGVSYVVTGGGGAYPTAIADDPHLAAYKSLYHYVVFDVDGENIRGTMKGAQGAVEDSFEWNHRSNPVPQEMRQARPEMKKSRRYQYADPY